MKDIFNIDASKMGLADIIKQLEDIQREANEAEKEIHEVESAATGETKTALKNMRKNAQDHSAAMASADYEKWQRTGVYDRTKAGFDKTLKGKETPDKAA
jgi:phage host-nuclease inhibitor protein Gam